MDFTKYSKEELDTTLTQLKIYRNLKKDLGSRGELVYKRLSQGIHTYIVEYFDAINEDTAWDNAKQVYKKAFGDEPKRKDVSFIVKSSLKGGIKVYLDDNMVDLSFNKVEKALRG